LLYSIVNSCLFPSSFFFSFLSFFSLSSLFCSFFRTQDSTPFTFLFAVLSVPFVFLREKAPLRLFDSFSTFFAAAPCPQALLVRQAKGGPPFLFALPFLYSKPYCLCFSLLAVLLPSSSVTFELDLGWSLDSYSFYAVSGFFSLGINQGEAASPQPWPPISSRFNFPFPHLFFFFGRATAFFPNPLLCSPIRMKRPFPRPFFNGEILTLSCCPGERAFFGLFPPPPPVRRFGAPFSFLFTKEES